MTTNSDLVLRVDTERILPMPRYAGGHDEQMRAMLKGSTVLAHWNEGGYQGQVATMVQLNDTGEIVIYDDYYGSCSGCDLWDAATDDDAIHMCKQIAASAKIFKTLKEAFGFLHEKGEYGNITKESREGLLGEMGLEGKA